eukprot:2195127-Prymnesium_polylepis.1
MSSERVVNSAWPALKCFCELGTWRRRRHALSDRRSRHGVNPCTNGYLVNLNSGPRRTHASKGTVQK